MSAKKSIIVYSIIILCFLPLIAIAATALTPSLAQDTIAKQLGWVSQPVNNCGGYYLEPPFTYPTGQEKLVEVTSESGLLSQRATSVLEGSVTVNRYGQQLTANKALLYRDPNTGKLSAIDLIGNVNYREPNTLVVAKRGRYNFETKTKSLIDIIYRTALNTGRQITGPNISAEEMQQERKITNMTAWGQASQFFQAEPRIYELTTTSFSTCPPIDPAWQVRASHIVLNKITGRGYATNARILLKNMPVFYFPYINFSIDKQRKTGFLWPSLGVSGRWGPYFLTPFYWNMAPNYDMTITPGLLTKRGVQVSDNFRYLTHISEGSIDLSVLPGDKAFSEFQTAASQNPDFIHPINTPIQSASVTQAELNRLLNSSDTRKAFSWRDESHFNDNLSSHVDFNYAGDDYYLQDFGSNLNEITKNQLLQEGDVYYKTQNWDFTGRLQTYQPLHPINESPFENQYRRFPQLILNGDYPNQAFGLEYFINNEATHFDIRNTPGTPTNKPIGNRLHTQPGVSLPLYWPSHFISPRFQLALTDYNLYQTAATGAPTNKRRAVPIFDILSGINLTRNTVLFTHPYQQTLEPQVYYVYIPEVDQSSIPIFDTTVNTLNYDQLFNYNRFTGIDRIGDANQVSLGMTTRLIDQETGFEKVRLGVGDIVYFSERHVTMCNDLSCSDNPFNHSNFQSLSPIFGVLDYHVNNSWKFTANGIWNPITRQLDNTTLAFQYQPDDVRLVNLGYTFARNGDILSGIATNDSRNNLKVTDASVAWPLLRDFSAVGRWSQNWNHAHLQNLLYGLQYDTCCWAMRLVGGRAFAGVDPNNNNKPQYNTEFYIQFSLKGLGDIGTGNPTGLLNSVTGYKSQFGQAYT